MKQPQQGGWQKLVYQPEIWPHEGTSGVSTPLLRINEYLGMSQCNDRYYLYTQTAAGIVNYVIPENQAHKIMVEALLDRADFEPEDLVWTINLPSTFLQDKTELHGENNLYQPYELYAAPAGLTALNYRRVWHETKANAEKLRNTLVVERILQANKDHEKLITMLQGYLKSEAV